MPKPATIFLSLSLFLFIATCYAQPEAIQKIAQQASVIRLKNNLFYLASDSLQGRLIGSHGDTLASLFVADWFKKCHLKAPYDNGVNYFQAISTQKNVLTTAVIRIAGISYQAFDGWSSFRYPIQPASVTEIPVTLASYDEGDSTFNNYENMDVKSKAVLVFEHGAKRVNFLSLIKSFKDRGALAVFLYDSAFDTHIKPIKQRAFYPTFTNLFATQGSVVSTQGSLSTFPCLLFSEKITSLLLTEDGLRIKEVQDRFSTKEGQHWIYSKSKITIHIERTAQLIVAPNVIGIMNGTDSAAGSIVVSAHHDHLGRDGAITYYGAVDNASGTVAIIEMAALMDQAIRAGLQPKRTIVFASFTGEEGGLLGSYYYATHPIYPMTKTWADMNIDMMGRVDSFYSGKRADSNYAYILVKDSLNRGLRDALRKANAFVQLNLDTRYELPENINRRLMGSDQYPLYLKGVPFVRIDCGFNKDYHQPGDTPEKINFELLTKQTQLAFLTLWNMAND